MYQPHMGTLDGNFSTNHADMQAYQQMQIGQGLGKRSRKNNMKKKNDFTDFDSLQDDGLDGDKKSLKIGRLFFYFVDKKLNDDYSNGNPGEMLMMPSVNILVGMDELVGVREASELKKEKQKNRGLSYLVFIFDKLIEKNRRAIVNELIEKFIPYLPNYKQGDTKLEMLKQIRQTLERNRMRIIELENMGMGLMYQNQLPYSNNSVQQ